MPTELSLDPAFLEARTLLDLLGASEPEDPRLVFTRAESAAALALFLKKPPLLKPRS